MTLRLLILGAVAITVSAAAPAPQAIAFSIDPVPSFSGVNVVQLSGTKDAGSTVTVQPIAPSTTSPCAPISGVETTWTCVAAVPNGPGLVITAVETNFGDPSSASTNPFDVLGPPTIDGDAELLTTGIISGRGFSGSTVTATVASASQGGCTSPVAPSGYWSCSLAVSSGNWSVTTTQARADLGGGQSSSVSGSLDVVVDKDAPAPPVVTSPRSGSRVTAKQVTYSGTGEAGGSLDLYVDRTPVCSSAVTDGGWSCSATAPPRGSHSVLAVQRDAAGNFSSPSSAIRISFGAPAPGMTESPPPPPVSPTPEPTSTPRPPIAGVAPDEPPPPAHATGGDWSTPTRFGALLPTLSSSVGSGSLLVAPLIALAFLALIALPVRLLATAVRGRTWRRPQLMGRNRDEPLPTEPRSPWLLMLLPFAIAVALVVFSNAVNDELRYLRLAIAVTIGLAILNLVGVALPAKLVHHRLAIPGSTRFTALLLLAAGVAAGMSRVTDIHPRVVAGVLIGTAFAGTIEARSRAIVRLAEVSAVTMLAVIGWIAHALLVDATAFVPVLGREVLATIALAGLGSAIVMVLPLGSLAGRVIFEWSFPAWLATTLIVATFAAVVFLGAGPASFPMIGSLALAVTFAIVSLSVWAWLKFVDPAFAG